MKLGFNLLLWTTHVTDEHWPIIERLKATGYDGIEVPMFEGTPDHYEKLGRRLRDIGLEATGVGVMAGGSAISPDYVQRAGAPTHLNWLTDCTAALGGMLVCGPFHQPLGEFSGRGPLYVAPGGGTVAVGTFTESGCQPLDLLLADLAERSS